MALSCGAKCAKYTLFAFNFIFWLAGAALLGVGIWFRVDKTALQVIHVLTVDTSDDLVIAAAYAIIAVGAIVFLTGFLGCCGAIKESSCMMITFACVLGLLLLLEITAGVLAAVFRNEIVKTLDSSMNKTVFTYYDQGSHEGSTVAWDFTQVEFKCCGATVGPADWKASLWAVNHTDPVPTTCCVLSNRDPKNPQPVDRTMCMLAAQSPSEITANAFVHTEGCKDGLKRWIKDHSALLIGVACAIAAIEVIAIILSCCLRSSFKPGYEPM